MDGVAVSITLVIQHLRPRYLVVEGYSVALHVDRGAALRFGIRGIGSESGGEDSRAGVLDCQSSIRVDIRNIIVGQMVIGRAGVPIGIEAGSKRIRRGEHVILFLIEPHLGCPDITHDDVAHLELVPLGIVVAPHIDNFFWSIIIVDNDVVVVVIEFILIASAYMRIRDGIPLEVIFIARCNAADALDTFRIAIALSSLRIAQDDPADGIAFVNLYLDAPSLLQLIDGIAARSTGGFAMVKPDFYRSFSECCYCLVLA